MPRIEFKPATPELVEAWYGKPSPFTLRGWVGVDQDGRAMGICGVYWIDKTTVAFSEWRPEVDRRTLARGVRLVERMLAEKVKGPVFAVPNETSEKLLARLGFVQTGDHALGGPLMVRA